MGGGCSGGGGGSGGQRLASLGALAGTRLGREKSSWDSGVPSTAPTPFPVPPAALRRRAPGGGSEPGCGAEGAAATSRGGPEAREDVVEVLIERAAAAGERDERGAGAELRSGGEPSRRRGGVSGWLSMCAREST